MCKASKTQSLLSQHEQANNAVALIRLGARMQVLESETSLSRAKLLRLYKEVRGMSPPKGMLPFSTDWFISWLPNIHASLFYNYYQRLLVDAGADRVTALINAYKLYREQTRLKANEDPVLALTRAWTLVRFVESDQLELAECQACSGNFIMHAHTPKHDYVCGICQPPSRAGIKTRADKTPTLCKPTQISAAQ